MTTAPESPEEVFVFRKNVRKRAWTCPGAGFALMGRPLVGLLSFVLSMATFATGIFTAINPSRAAALSTVGLLVAGTVLWLVEISVSFAAWPPAPADRPATGSRRYLWGAAALFLAAAAFGAALFFSFRLVEVQDAGMLPTIFAGDRVLYHARVRDERLVPGTVILFGLSKDNKITEPGQLSIGRILAVPGDKISIAGTFYRVNGQITNTAAPPPEEPAALEIPRLPAELVVPENCYFITQDNVPHARQGPGEIGMSGGAVDDATTKHGADSRTLGWAERDRIVSTQLYQVSRRPLLAPIE